jgi:hypothetical protein
MPILFVGEKTLLHNPKPAGPVKFADNPLPVAETAAGETSAEYTGVPVIRKLFVPTLSVRFVMTLPDDAPESPSPMRQ